MTANEPMHSSSNLKYLGIFDYTGYTVFMIKRNLHKDSLFSERYMISNVIVLENDALKNSFFL